QAARDDILDIPAIDRLDREAARSLEAALLDADATEAAIALGPELDPPGHAVAIGRELLRRPARPVEHGAEVPAAHRAIADRHILAGNRAAEREARFHHDRLVVRRVDAAARNRHPPHAVEVDAVAV